MTIKYTFTEKHFNSFKSFVEQGMMDDFFATDLVYDYICEDLEATDEQVAELRFQFLQALAQTENKSFEEIVSYYERVSYENDLRISAEMEPEIDCWIRKNELEDELEELKTMAAQLNAKIALKSLEVEMKEAEWKTLSSEGYGKDS